MEKSIEYKRNTNEGEEVSQYPPILSYDESGNEEELIIQTNLFNKKLGRIK